VWLIYRNEGVIGLAILTYFSGRKIFFKEGNNFWWCGYRAFKKNSSGGKHQLSVLTTFVIILFNFASNFHHMMLTKNYAASAQINLQNLSRNLQDGKFFVN
jgi:hypothetical protein